MCGSYLTKIKPTWKSPEQVLVGALGQLGASAKAKRDLPSF